MHSKVKSLHQGEITASSLQTLHITREIHISHNVINCNSSQGHMTRQLQECGGKFSWNKKPQHDFKRNRS